MALLRAEFMSYSLKRMVPISVVLPCDTTNFRNLGPDPAQPPYKTLYLLHGIYGSDMDWVTNTNIHRLARERQIAVVMPSGENHFYTDSGTSAEKYGEFIGKELVEVTRRMFRLSSKREDTYIAGLSMGGYGAFMNGLIYHDVFSYVACLSMAILDKSMDYNGVPPMDDPDYMCAVFGQGDMDKTLRTQRALTEKYVEERIPFPKLYLTVGHQDILYEANVKFHEFLQEKGIDHIFETSDGYHNFDFWSRAIRDILDWLPHGEKIVLADSGNVFNVK